MTEFRYCLAKFMGFVSCDRSAVPLELFGTISSALLVAGTLPCEDAPPAIRILPVSVVVFCRGSKTDVPYALGPQIFGPAAYHLPVFGSYVLIVCPCPTRQSKPFGIRCILE